MALKVGFGGCDILEPDDACLFDFENSIYEEERISMRKNVLNFDNI
jgi:hypothetical protein